MDDDFLDGGFIIATEGELDGLFGGTQPEPFDIATIPGRNIKTGCYGLFLIALDKCTDPTEIATLEEALDALDNVRGCFVSCALTIYYPKAEIDTGGILKLAEVMIHLSDIAPMIHATDVSEAVMTDIDQQIADILNINAEEAVLEFFEKMGFKPEPMEIPYDGPRQTEFDFG